MEPDSWLGVELRHLAALQAVAEEGSFGRAATRLGYTQSAVSQQIGALERIVGMPVLHRPPGGRRPLELTEAGRVVLAHARPLLARVKALLRRAEPPADSPRIIEIGKLAIDPASYRVSHSGKPVPLSTLEFRLLYYLASRPNRVFTRDQLLDAVWGTDRFVTPRSVDVYVRRLREKIESDPENPNHLKTVRGAGYLFETRAA